MKSKKELPYLIHESGKKVPIGSKIIIGRTSGNIIIRGDEKLSSTHALLEFKLNDVYITDLGSTNGVTINNNTISVNTPTAVPHNAQIKVGNQIFTLDYPEAEIGNVSALTTIAPLKIINSKGLEKSPQEGRINSKKKHSA